LRSLAVRSRNFLKASGAPKPVTADAETFIRKLSGGRKSPKVKADPNAKPAAPAAKAPTSSSASQMSYDNRVGHFESYIEVVKNVPAYKPNEAELKVAALTALAADLKDKSSAVSTASATLNQAGSPPLSMRLRPNSENTAGFSTKRRTETNSNQPIHACSKTIAMTPAVSTGLAARTSLWGGRKLP